MLETATKLDFIQADSAGNVSVKLTKQVLNGVTVISGVPHRFSVAPDDDLATMLAAVNADLVGVGFPAIGDGDISRVNALVAAARGGA